MSPEVQRYEIAKACGLQEISIKACLAWSDGQLRAVPDYLNDLNAMHEAEKMLSHEKLLSFDRHLADVVGTNPQRSIHSTAQERAEAYCRVILEWRGQWIH